MKKIINIILPCFMVFFTSCEDDFIDLTPLASITEDVYFSEPIHYEQNANSFYRQMVAFRPTGGSNIADFMDYGTDLTSYTEGTQQDYGRGVVSLQQVDSYWNNAYSYIRANNVLLKRAESYAGDVNDIKEYIAIAKFFRAWNYYFLVQRYGGVPLITKVLDTDSEELKSPRNSRYEVVAQVLKDLEEAIVDLPLEQNIGTDNKGKLSKWAAMAFKGRVLLYEATWMKYVQTSTDGDGVSNGAGSEGYSASNVNSYLQESADVLKTVMDEGGYELWNYNSLLDNKSSFYLFNLEDGGSNPAGLDKSTNKEFILYNKYDFDLYKGNTGLTHGARGRLQPSRKMMDMFLCLDGKTINDSPLFKGYVKTSDEYQNRDYRMRAYFADYDTYEVPVDGSIVLNQQLSTGYYNQKFCTYNYGEYRQTKEESADYPQIRLAAVYLMYAEALVELNGSLTDTQMSESINKVKARAGLPAISNSSLIANGMNIKDEIRRERTIELYAENSRYVDLKRWGLAEEVLGEPIAGAVIEGTDYENNAALYNPSSYQFGEISVATGSGTLKAVQLDAVSNRNFSRTNYLHPLPTLQVGQTEVLQNPGY